VPIFGKVGLELEVAFASVLVKKAAVVAGERNGNCIDFGEVVEITGFGEWEYRINID
jgi:hypothetical protein